MVPWDSRTRPPASAHAVHRAFLRADSPACAGRAGAAPPPCRSRAGHRSIFVALAARTAANAAAPILSGGNIPPCRRAAAVPGPPVARSRVGDRSLRRAASRWRGWSLRGASSRWRGRSLRGASSRWHGRSLRRASSRWRGWSLRGASSRWRGRRGGNDALGNAVLLLQGRQLVGGQVPPLARAKPLGSDSGKREAREAHDSESSHLAHPANLLVASLRDCQLKPGLAPFVAKELGLRRKGLSVLELDPSPPEVQIFGLHLSVHFDDVFLRSGPAWVRQTLCEVAVVGRKEDPAGVEIEPADRKDTRGYRGKELAHAGSSLGVVHRGHDAPGLVQDDVDG